MKNGIKNFLVLAVVLFAQQSDAQQKASNPSGGGGGFTIGYGSMDVAKLHEFVPPGIKFSNQHLLIGGTGHGFNGNLVIGGGGFGIIGDKITTDTINYSLGGGIGTFDFGYLVVNKEKLKVYPMIGIGGGGYGLQISSNKNIAAKNIADNPGHEININRGGFILDLSANLNFIPMLEYNEKDNTYGGFMMGLKVGYIYSIPSSDWKFTGGDITGGPKFGMNMAYLKLIIGGSGSQRN